MQLTCSYPRLLIAALALFSAVWFGSLSIGRSARYNVVGSRDQPQFIRLKSQYDLTPGTVLKLPIDVPEEYLTLFGTLPPRLVSISSPNADGVYGIGDVILIDLRFTTEVGVVGNPLLRMNTGCFDASCITKEVQSFKCAADRGTFALRLVDQYVMNINVNVTRAEFKKLLEQLDGVEQVFVTYGDEDDRDYSMGDRVCTSKGNNVTILFEKSSFPQYNGDVPSLEYSRTNDFLDPRTSLDLGTGEFLSGVNYGYDPVITSNTLVNGAQQVDGTANYLTGNGTNTVRFSYVVKSGEFTNDLEVRSMSFVEGSIFSPVTFANVSTEMPRFGAGPRYLSISSVALGFNQNIAITSAAPQIVSVTSTNANGVYTVGDVVVVQVVYNLPVKIFSPELLLLQLSTGRFNRQIPLAHVTNESKVLEFQYLVQELDSSDRLDILAANSLTLNGGLIFRATSTNDTVANITLPSPGSANSLSVNKNIAISTVSPVIVDVRVVTPVGEYTAGDNIDVLVTYDTKIRVEGSPRLAIINNPASLQTAVRTAPFTPSHSFTRTRPGENAQLVLELRLNLHLQVGDMLIVSLPDFSIREPVVAEANRTLRLEGDSANAFEATWLSRSSKLYLTANQTIVAGETIALLVSGSSGVFTPTFGVIPSKSGIRFSVEANAVSNVFTGGYTFNVVGSIGFSDISGTLRPLRQSSTVTEFTLQFSVAEPLAVDDSLSIQLVDLVSFENATVVQAYSYYSLTWDPASATIHFNVTANTSEVAHVINLAALVPISIQEQGTTKGSVLVYASFVNNGEIAPFSLPSLPSICSIDTASSSVMYTNKLPGAASAVVFRWKTGLSTLGRGDRIVFTLPSNSTTSTAKKSVASVAISGADGDLFFVTVDGAVITFTVAFEFSIEAFTTINVSLDETVGLVVPPTGLQASDSFKVQVFSTACIMETPVDINFTSNAIIRQVSRGIVLLDSSPADLALGVPVSIQVSVDLYEDMKTGDQLFLTIPEFSRDPSVDPLNNSVVSNGNISTRFNRRLQRLEFTFLSEFPTAGSSTGLSILVLRSGKFSTPSTNLKGSSFLLSIRSASGTIVLSDYEMTGPCIGFCTASVVFSQVFLSFPADITFSLSHSETLTVGSTLMIYMNGGANISTTSATFITVGGSNLLCSFADVGDNNLSLILPVDIAGGTAFSVTMMQTIITAVGDISPSISILTSVGRATVTVPAVALKPYYSLGTSNLSFTSIHSNRQADVNWIIQLTNSSPDLAIGDELQLNLPGFKLTGASPLLLKGISNSSFSDIAWDNVSHTVTLVVSKPITTTVTLALTFVGLSIPASGVTSLNASQAPNYIIGVYNTLADGVLADCYTPKQPMSAIEDVAAVSDFAISVATSDGDNFALSTISFEFSIVRGVKAMDQLVIQLPGIVSYSNFTNGESINPLQTSFPVDIIWDAFNNSFLLRMSSDDSSAFFAFSIDVLNYSLVLGSEGFHQYSFATISLLPVDTGAINEVILNATTPLPCLGLCNAAISPTVAKAGFATSYSITLSLSSINVSELLNVSLLLSGFERSSDTGVAVTATESNLPISLSFTLSWLGANSALVLSNFSYSRDHPLTSLVFEVPVDFGLRLPVSGYRYDGDLLVAKYSVDTSAVRQFESKIVSISPVGVLLESFCSFAPILPNANVSSAFSFRFKDPLIAGDVIKITLRDFVVPSGLLRLQSSHSINARGIPSLTTSVTNVDGSSYSIRSVSILEVELQEGLSAEEMMSFVLPNTSQIVSPSKGVHGQLLPRIAVVSQSSPIATAVISNTTGIGSLSPSAVYGIAESSTLNTVSYYLNFTVHCAIYENDSIGIRLPNIVVHDGYKTTVDINSVVATNVMLTDASLHGEWDEAEQLVRVVLAKNTYILRGGLHFFVTISNATLSTLTVYENDQRNEFMLSSFNCMVDYMPFDASSASFLKSSSIRFGSGAMPNGTVDFLLGFHLATNLVANDRLLIRLPGFRVFNESLPLLSSSRSPFSNIVEVGETPGELFIFWNLTANISAGEIVGISLDRTFNALVAPSTGFDGQVDAVSISLLRKNNSGSELEVFTGLIQVVQSIGYFEQSIVQVQTASPGSVTALNLQWVLSLSMNPSDSIVLELADFDRQLKDESGVFLSGSAADQFEGSWNYATKELTLTAVVLISKRSSIHIMLPDTNGFITPVAGIASSSAAYAISASIGSTTFTQQVDDISVVPVVLESSIVFLSSESNNAFRFAGNSSYLQLYPGHPLIDLDVGSQFAIEEKVYTILAIADDIMRIQEVYNSTRVFLSMPQTILMTPSTRYADYFQGNDSNQLVFRYKVRRGDISENITLSDLQLNSGKLLRFSQDPAVPASLLLPITNIGRGISVNSNKPLIAELFTTSRSGVYSFGQKLDFHVKFSYSVVVESFNFTVPTLLLQVGPFGRVAARYMSGSGTNTIVFTYVVELSTNSFNIDSRILTTDPPIIQPLRIINGNYFNSLRRKAVVPTLNANILFPSSTTVNIPANLTMLGVGLKVIQVASLPSRLGNVFSAGDILNVLVTFSGPVTVVGDEVPYIVLRIGTSPVIAFYAEAVNSTTLLFQHIISTNDSTTDGLSLWCTCSDYYQRSYIELGTDGQIVSAVTPSVPVSLILANSSDIEELLINSFFVIDNSSPSVTRVFSNISSSDAETVVILPGDVVSITVEFTADVLVVGSIYLEIKGEDGNCPAHYYQGNSTHQLVFLYVANYQSGISKLEYAKSSSLVTKVGSIFRLSDHPIIEATVTLPRPGTATSLGLQANIDVDPTDLEPLEMTFPLFDGAAPNQAIFLATSSFSFNLHEVITAAGAQQFQYQYNGGVLVSNTSINDAVALVEAGVDGLQAKVFSYGIGISNYSRLLAETTTGFPIVFSPRFPDETRLDNYWFNTNLMRAVIDLRVSFSGLVQAQDVYLQMSSGSSSVLNRAFVSEQGYSYTLTVKKALTEQDTNAFYRLEYDGRQTRCISITADAGGAYSIQAALEDLPSLKILKPCVSKQSETHSLIIYSVDFTHLPNHDLKVIAGLAIADSCFLPAGDEAVLFKKRADSLIFQQVLHKGYSIAFYALSNILEGSYTITIPIESGVGVSLDGAKSSEMMLEVYDKDGKRSGITALANNHVPGVIRSTLGFTSKFPSTNTAMSVYICELRGFDTNDTIRLRLTHFNESNTTPFTVAGIYTTIVWDPSSEALEFLFLNRLGCLDEEVDRLLLPLRTFPTDSKIFSFDILRSGTERLKVLFDTVTGVGLLDFALNFENPRPGFVTDLTIEFNLVFAEGVLYDNSTTIQLVLPGFDSNHSSFSLDGTFARHFVVNGVDLGGGQAVLLISPTQYIVGGQFKLHVIATSENSLVFPFNGLNSRNPPSVSFNSSVWSSLASGVGKFDESLGLNHVPTIEISFSNGSLSVQQLRITLNFTEPLIGPVTVLATLPSFTSSGGSFAVSNGTTFDRVEWIEATKILNIYSQSGYGDGLVDVVLSNFSDFRVSKIGVSVQQYGIDAAEDGLSINVTCSDGILRTVPLISTTVIPAISYANIMLPDLAEDAFVDNIGTILIEISTTYPVSIGDVFLIQMDGLYVFGAENFHILDGPCASLLNVSDPTLLSANASLGIVVTNSSSCIYNSTSMLRWTLVELSSSTFRRSVIQYGSSAFRLAWTANIPGQAVFVSGFYTMDSVPSVGITYSSLEITAGSAGERANITLKIITGSKLKGGDELILKLFGFSFFWSSVAVQDNFYRIWAATHTSTTDSSRLVLSTPDVLYPTALSFEFNGVLAPRLPFAGIRGEGSGYQIEIRSGSKILSGQPLARITPVRHVEFFSFRPQSMVQREANELSTSSGFTLSWKIVPPLSLGDQIEVELANFQVIQDYTMDLTSGGNVYSVVFIRLTNTIVITTTSAGEEYESVEIPASTMVEVQSQLCLQFVQCAAAIRISSATSSVFNYTAEIGSTLVLGNSTSIAISYSVLPPTLFPTFAPTTATNDSLNNPSSQPTSMPSSQPSSCPTSQPSSQPTAMPNSPLNFTFAPSFLPTASPTTIYKPSVLLIDFNFTLLSRMKEGDYFSIRVPRLSSLNGSDLTLNITQNSAVGGLTTWLGKWNETNKILKVIAQAEIQPGAYEIIAASSSLQTDGKIIYEGDDSFTYRVISAVDGFEFQAADFDRVLGYGVSNSSLTLANPIAGQISSLELIVDFATTEVAAGSLIYLYLPGFTKLNESDVGVSSNTAADLTWSNATSTLLIRLTAAVTGTLQFVLGLENRFVVPLAGSNSLVNQPTISLRRSDGLIFEATPVNIYEGVAPRTLVSVTFARPVAGAETRTVVDIVSNGFHKFGPDESMILILPQFLSLKKELVATVSQANVTITSSWIPCEETIEIRFNDVGVFTNITISIDGLILPTYGVDELSVARIVFSSYSQYTGRLDLLPEQLDFPLIGYVISSEIALYPPRIQSELSVAFQFKLSIDLFATEKVELKIVNANFSSIEPTFEFSSHQFLSSWSERGSTITLHALENISALTNIEVVFNESFTPPSTGFPVGELLLSVNTNRGVVVGATPLGTISRIGILSSSIVYDIVDYSDSIAMQLHLHLSNKINVGDELILHVPALMAVKDVQQLVISGDLADRNFLPSFTGTFNNQTIRFTAVRSEPARKLVVHVDRASNLKLARNISASIKAQHSIALNVSSIGYISMQHISHSPSSLPKVFANELVFSSCEDGVGCSVSFTFDVFSEMQSGEALLISSPSITKVGQGTTGSIGVNSSYFCAEWDPVRYIDAEESASLTTLEGGYLQPVTDRPSSLSVGTVISPNVVSTASRSNLVTVVVDIPKIVRVYASGVPGDTTLAVGDSVVLILQFDAAVLLFHPVSLNILLSSGEFARYRSGNGTDALLFIYNVKSPVSTTDLSILGPGAVELASRSIVVALENPRISANLTVPEPYNRLLRVDGRYWKLAVDSNVTATVASVQVYSTDFKTYATGDVIDIAVSFSRPVVVEGTPQLLLSDNNCSATSSTFTARYVNVSSTQYLTVAENTVFALSLQNYTTDCIGWNDSATLTLELMKLDILSLALPLSVKSIGIAKGIQYQLSFAGVAPPIFSSIRLFCDENEKLATVSVEDTLLSKAIFRYNVVEGDFASRLGYCSVTSLVTGGSDKIFLASKFSRLEVDYRLPQPLFANSLANSSNVRIHTSSPVIEAVYSNHTGVAVSGDIITICVKYSAPVEIKRDLQRDPSAGLYLELELQSMKPTSDEECCLRNSTFTRVDEADPRVICFEYNVKAGDVALPLRTSAINKLYLRNASVLLRSINPTTTASLSLPSISSDAALNASQVLVNATAPPTIRRVYSDHTLGRLSTGDEVLIIVQFTAEVFVGAVNEVSQSLPFVFLTAPGDGANIFYQSGSGTKELVFLYVVEEGHTSSNISFYFNMENGYLFDCFGSNVTDLSGNLYVLADLQIDGFPAIALYVNVTEADGFYYPGEALDVYIVFNKEVAIFNSDACSEDICLPSLELFVPSQYDFKLLARYSHGNNTNVLHFKYTIPSPNYFIAPQSPIIVDYAGAAALFHHLNGSVIRDSRTISAANTNVFLPSEDESYLANQRDVYVDFTVAYVVEVIAKNASGIYTAGDTIAISVIFSSPVMVFVPPALKLHTGSFNRSALYTSGNNTKELMFLYTIQRGDVAGELDYVDTRKEPYRTSNPSVSLALSFDVQPSPAVAADRVTEVKLLPSSTGGIFMASAQLLIPVSTSLPLPGAKGSLSATSSVTVDTTAPFVRLVTTPVTNGSIGEGIELPISLVFSYAVVVGGCPRLLFKVSGVDQFAYYTRGSGSTSLEFLYLVDGRSFVTEFDYFDRFSLRLFACNTSERVMNGKTSQSIFIKRQSLNPTIDANLTMPWVGYIESVIAPRSLLGGGKNLTLAGSNAYPRLIWTNVAEKYVSGLGDVIDINIGFSRSVSLPANAFLLTTNAKSNVQQRDRIVWNTTAVNDTTVRFLYVVNMNEVATDISYPTQYALITPSTSCGVIDLTNSIFKCAAQNLPLPFSTRLNSLDSFSTKTLSVKAEIVPVVSSLRYVVSKTNEETIHYRTGEIVSVQVQFSEEVFVYGSPTIQFFDKNLSEAFAVRFISDLGNRTLLFEYELTDSMYNVAIVCTERSVIDLNGGVLLRSANFLPIIPAELSLRDVCCPMGICSQGVTVSAVKPFVQRVYSNQSGIFSTGEEILLFVEFSESVKVIGSGLKMRLDLVGSTESDAFYLSKFNRNTVILRYVVQSTDYTSSLDYISTQALFVEHPSLVYLDSAVGLIEAELMLPRRGSKGSLGRESDLIINVDRPNLVTSTASPFQTTTGDDLLIVLKYSAIMQVVNQFDQPIVNNVTGQLNNFASGYDVGLSISIYTDEGRLTLQAERTAYLISALGDSVVFRYRITQADPTGAVFYTSNTPFIFNGSTIISAVNSAAAPRKFSDPIAVGQLCSIDNEIPQVVRVFSTDSNAEFAFGVGDVINIFVEMSLNCLVVETPSLLIRLDEYIGSGVPTAVYVQPVNATSQAVRLLQFQYTVQNGDVADPLEYVDSFSLLGKLLRFSASDPFIVANLTLPNPRGQGSLGFCCNVQIDSSEPYIESVVPLKRPGIYGENETIVILVRFTKPVVVIGSPSIVLRVGTSVSSVGIAEYIESFTADDVLIDRRKTDVFFRYIVQRSDNVLSLIHNDSSAILVSNTSAILHATSSPTTPADVSLREPNDHTVVKGLVERQWKYRYPKKVELLLRDLYHTQPDALTVSLEHVDQTATIFSQCCSSKTFGKSYPQSRLGTNATTLARDTGIGYDMLFSDTVAVNIARFGLATQSTTRVSAKRAIDGNINPLIGDESVTETNEEDNAWWQLFLPEQSTLRSFNLWSRKPQQWIEPIVQFVINGLDTYPAGTFRLRFSSIADNALTDGTVYSVSTDKIPIGATADQVSQVIKRLTPLGNVGVTRQVLSRCGESVQNFGCGSGLELGDGFSYRLTFYSLRVADPELEIFELLFPGQGAIVTPPNFVGTPPINVQSYQVVTHVERIRSGFFKEVPEVPVFGKGIDPSNYTDILDRAKAGENEWLTPFWVFIFTGDAAPPTGLNESIASAVWFERYESIGKTLSVVLKGPIVGATYLKVQREGYGSISLAEVEVFEEKINNLQEYGSGSPVAAAPLTQPYQPLDSFLNTFRSLRFDGRWLVQFSQNTARPYSTNFKWSGADGTISEAVLIITDLVGIVHSYYQDLRGEVVSLPKFGTLLKTASSTGSPYNNWRQLFEVAATGELRPKTGFERLLGYCYGSPSCEDNYGVGPLLNNQVLGARPESYFFRNERLVQYQPVTGYLGPDYFTYQIYDGVNIQQHTTLDGSMDSLNEVTMHVRACRRFEARLMTGGRIQHPLCDSCGQTENSLFKNVTDCLSIVSNVICGDAALQGNFLTLCLACGSVDTDASLQDISGECKAQIIRSVSFVSKRGLCSSDVPPMDCSTETFTVQGREKVNFLSLQPPTPLGAFTRLGNSFGGYGWYDTPDLV